MRPACAMPACPASRKRPWPSCSPAKWPSACAAPPSRPWANSLAMAASLRQRSEEHTSELQSRPHLVCRLLLEKKKNQTNSVNPAGGNRATPPGDNRSIATKKDMSSLFFNNIRSDDDSGSVDVVADRHQLGRFS